MAYARLSRYAAWRRRPPTARATEQLLKLKGLAVEEYNRDTEIDFMGKPVRVSNLNAGQIAAYL